MKYLLLTLFLSTALIGSAQTNEEQIKEVITNLFTAMQSGDTAKANLCFEPNAKLQTALINATTKNTKLITESVDSFLVQIVKIKNQQLKIEERITNIKIDIDEPMAAVWAHYEFYVNNTLSHTGVDAFQLFKSNQGWKIIQICDTRKKAEKP